MAFVRAALLAMLLSFPFFSYAAVVVNEVAWMGTLNSPNDEWIELFNNGSKAVDLSGWTLSDGKSLDIPLKGIVAAGDYAVLERTDDSSASGTAFLIYKGALSNQGRTLTLMRTDGSVEDMVEGGAKWANIGGNNTTKETAQRIGSSWQTAPPSPGEANIPLPPPPPTPKGSASTSISKTEPIVLGASAETNDSRKTQNKLPYYGLAGVLVVSILALYTRGKEKKS